MSKEMKLPTDAKERKGIPLVTGVLDYFPDALSAVAELSLKGNQQHHKDAPLHWDKSKSSDHADCLGRHLIDRGTLDNDGVRHSAKVAWRALALLQVEIDKEKAEELAVKEKEQESAPRCGSTFTEVLIKPSFKIGDDYMTTSGYYLGKVCEVVSDGKSYYVARVNKEGGESDASLVINRMAEFLTKPEFKVGDRVIINTGYRFGRAGKINSIVGSGCVVKLDGWLERGYVRVVGEVLVDMQDIKLLYKD